VAALVNAPTNLLADIDNLSAAKQAVATAQAAAPDYSTNVDTPTDSTIATATSTAQKTLSAWSDGGEECHGGFGWPDEGGY